MAKIEALDSKNIAVRFIERWKRGVGVLAILSLMIILPGLLATFWPYAIFEWIGVVPAWRELLAIVIAMIAVPWLAGNRNLLRILGRAAIIPDDTSV